MSASQAERRRFESGHPLEQISNDIHQERGLIELENLRPSRSSTTLVFQGLQDQRARLIDAAIFCTVAGLERTKPELLIHGPDVVEQPSPIVLFS